MGSTVDSELDGATTALARAPVDGMGRDPETGHATRHLLEASSVTAFQSGQHQVELQLGHVCNNRCVFCVSGQLTEQRLAKPIALDEILQAIEEAAASGAKRLTFLGGEPTVHKSFKPALKRAVELGFEDIVVFTNGVKARKPQWVNQIADMGRFEWRFSIQGGDAESHDRVTGRAGSFQRIVDGMTTLQARGEDITANCCVNAHSYRSLPKFFDVAKAHGVRQLHFDQVRPEDAGLRSKAYLQSIMPRYSDMAAPFAELLERFEADDPHYDINLGNFPYCVLPEWAHKIHHDGELTYTISVDPKGDLQPAFDKYPNKRQDKFHPPQCGKCVFVDQCNGVFETYAEFYGTDEFRPVSMARLVELDHRDEFFAVTAEPAVAPIWQTAPPKGWELDEVFRNTRDRRLDVRFRHLPTGGTATLVATPRPGQGRPVSAPDPVLSTDRFALSVLASATTPPAEVVALVAHAEGALDAHEGVGAASVTVTSEPAQTMRVLLGTDRISRARRRVQKLASRLSSRDRYGSWRYAGTHPLGDGVGARVRLTGPSGGVVDVRLEVGDQPGGPPVAVRYEVGAATDAESARAVLAEALAQLRGRGASSAVPTSSR